MPCNFNPKRIKDHNVFVETGTYTGNTVKKFKDLYETYHTIEIVESFYNQVRTKFKDSNVIFHLGDSPVVLSSILKTIDEPATFWLDAHYQGGKQPGDTHSPIKSELVAIGQHHIKDHLIMLDDVRLFGKYGTSVKEVKSLLLKINPKYSFKFKAGITDSDVLVAYIR